MTGALTTPWGRGLFRLSPLLWDVGRRLWLNDFLVRLTPLTVGVTPIALLANDGRGQLDPRLLPTKCLYGSGHAE